MKIDNTTLDKIPAVVLYLFLHTIFGSVCGLFSRSPGGADASSANPTTDQKEKSGLMPMIV